MSDDFGFEDVPMPYDITIMAKGAGSKEVEYTVVGARQNTPLTAEEVKEFESKPSLDEVIEKLKEKQGEPTVQQDQPQSGYEKAKAVATNLPRTQQPAAPANEAPPEEINEEDIPF